MRRLWLVVILAGCATSPRVAPKQYRIIGYITHRTDIERIDATKLTHINYAFAKVRGDDYVAFEDSDAAANLGRIRDLKKINPRLQILLSIGGWGAEWFSDAALTSDARCRFSSSAIALMDQYDLDGLDIDWEYPGQPGAGNRFRAEDRENFTALLAELRYELDLLGAPRGRHYLLTIASSGGRYFDHTEMDRVNAYIDWFNVMTYDFVAGWSRVTGHHAGLLGTGKPRVPASAEGFVAQHLAAGIPPDKIVVGVPFYGKWFRWVTTARRRMGSTSHMTCSRATSRTRRFSTTS